MFRGSVLPVERRPLMPSKAICSASSSSCRFWHRTSCTPASWWAALDRQHPRDLFDVWQLFESGDISDGMVECFVIYLAGHNRPPHEVLFGNNKDIAGEYERAFVGMTEVDCSLETLLDARARMRRELPQRLSTTHRRVPSGLARAEPDSSPWCSAGTPRNCRHCAGSSPISKHSASAVPTTSQRNPPPSTPAWARADEHPRRPLCRGCPMPHSSWQPRSSGPHAQRLPTKAKGLGRGKGRAPRGKALS
ncbi:hypothetical protein SSTU70S_06959 [Stutzerimonas stutzeri]